MEEIIFKCVKVVLKESEYLHIIIRYLGNAVWIDFHLFKSCNSKLQAMTTMSVILPLDLSVQQRLNILSSLD
jgi:hypothetical protein